MKPTIIRQQILELSGEKVMLDFDLAILYQVETRILNQAVKRNKSSFPKDFMFQLTKAEVKILMSQIVISSWGGTRKIPYAFTEHGVTMLATVLRSPKAVKMNISIVRAFIALRKIAWQYKEIAEKLAPRKAQIINSSKKFTRS